MKTFIAMLLLSLTGCGAIATRQPLYDAEKEPILNGRLVGTWYRPDAVLRVYLWRHGLWMQDVTPGCGEKSHHEAWAVDLVRIRKGEFLFPAFPPRYGAVEPAGTLLFSCYRVDLSDDGSTLRLRLLNTVALGEFLQNHPGEMKYEELPNGWPFVQASATQPATQSSEPTTRDTVKIMILTDDPKRIRQFLSDHADDPNFLLEPIIFHRVAGS